MIKKSVVLILLILLFTSCGEKQEGEFIPPYFEDLGKPKSEIFETYGITEEDTYLDWGTEIGLYLYPKEVTYLGVPHFSVAFHVNSLAEKQPLSAFTYYRIYEGDSEELLPLVKDFYQKFSDWNPPLKVTSETSFSHILEADTLTDLERNDYFDSWPSTDEKRLTFFKIWKSEKKDKWVVEVQYTNNITKNDYLRS